MKRFALAAALLVAALGACADDDKRQAAPTEPAVAPSASRVDAAAAGAEQKSSVCLAVEKERASRAVVASKKLDRDAAEAREDVAEMDELLADACQ